MCKPIPVEEGLFSYYFIVNAIVVYNGRAEISPKNKDQAIEVYPKHKRNKCSKRPI